MARTDERLGERMAQLIRHANCWFKTRGNAPGEMRAAVLSPADAEAGSTVMRAVSSKGH